jgi:hypothetical protein
MIKEISISLKRFEYSMISSFRKKMCSTLDLDYKAFNMEEKVIENLMDNE